jgi:hypothetical protein
VQAAQAVKRGVTRRNDAESIETSSNTCKSSEKGCSGKEDNSFSGSTHQEVRTGKSGPGCKEEGCCASQEGCSAKVATIEEGGSPKGCPCSNEGTSEEGCLGNTSTLEESCRHETCPC